MNNILVVVDMQKDFVKGAFTNKEIKSIVPDVVKKVSKFKGKVYFTKDTHDKNYSKTLEGKNIKIKHCLLNSEGHELIDDLKPFENKKNVILKTTFSTKEVGEFFYKLDKKEKINSITLIGVCLDICVVSNAITLRSFLPNTKIIVDSKCVAATTIDNYNATLKVLKQCLVKII